MAIKSAELKVLDRECDILSRRFTGEMPGDYVLEKYRDAHSVTNFFEIHKPFDRFLLKLSFGVPFFLKFTDAYTSLFFRNSTIRKKSILLLAILESSSPAYRHFDRLDDGNRGLLAIRALWRVSGFTAILFVSVLLFMPLHILFEVFARSTGR